MKFYATDKRFRRILKLKNPEEARLITKTAEYKINRRADFDKNKFAILPGSSSKGGARVKNYKKYKSLLLLLKIFTKKNNNLHQK